MNEINRAPGPHRRLTTAVRVLAATVVASSLVACGGGASSSAPKRSTGGSAPPSTQARLSTDIGTAKGIVAIKCQKGSIVVRVTDPANGEPVAERAIALMESASPTYCGSDGQRTPSPAAPFLRQMFDAKFGRLAVGVQAEGEAHVGYIDLATGRLVDLTSQRPASQFGSKRRDAAPLFRPDSDELWYKDLSSEPNGLKSMKVAGAEPTDHGELDQKLDAKQFFFSPQTGGLVVVPGTLAPVPSQDGKFAISRCDEDPSFASPKADCHGFVLMEFADGVLETGHAGGSVRRGSVRNVIADPTVCTPTAWVGVHTFLCEDRSRFMVGTLDGAMTAVSLREVLPATDRYNTEPLVSPAGDYVLFSSQGATGAGGSGLFRVSLTPGSQPVLVRTSDMVPFGGTPVEWRP